GGSARGERDIGSRRTALARLTCLFDDRAGLSKPRPLAAPEVAGHRRFLCEDALGPFTRLSVALLLEEEGRVVVVGLGERRDRRGLFERRVGAIGLAAPGVGVP